MVSPKSPSRSSSPASSQSLLLSGALAGSLCALASPARADTPAAANMCFSTAMTTVTGMPTPCVDGRTAIPLNPAPSWRDGFFVEYSSVPDLGFSGRVSIWYMRDPLGTSPMTGSPISDRLMVEPVLMFSLGHYVDIGAMLPIIPWQDSHSMVDGSAIGDLRLHLKGKVPLWEEILGIAVVADVGIPTGDPRAIISANQVSFYPKAIVDVHFKKRLRIAANLGGVLAGTGSAPCDPTTQPVDPMTMKMTPCPTSGTLPQLFGLGNQFWWGASMSVGLGEDKAIFATAEVMGSVASVTTTGTRAPVFWDVGLRKAKSGNFTFGLMYGNGIGTGAPNSTVMLQIGYAWEHSDPEKEKKPEIKVVIPDFNINVNVTNPGGGAPATSTAVPVSVPPTAPGGVAGAVPVVPGAVPVAPGAVPVVPGAVPVAPGAVQVPPGPMRPMVPAPPGTVVVGPPGAPMQAPVMVPGSPAQRAPGVPSGTDGGKGKHGGGGKHDGNVGGAPPDGAKPPPANGVTVKTFKAKGGEADVEVPKDWWPEAKKEKEKEKEKK